MQFEDWIEQAYSLGASDLHLEADTPIVARIRGELHSIGANVSGATLEQVARDLLGERWPQFIERGSADHSESIGGIRLPGAISIRRCAASRRRCGCWRPPSRICVCAICTGTCASSSSRRAVSVIISGPTGSGKSTTLAALIEEINATRARHIVTLESPIEYLFANRQSFIRQREIPTPFAELRAGDRRCPARESRRAGDQRDAHTRGHAAHA